MRFAKGVLLAICLIFLPLKAALGAELLFWYRKRRCRKIGSYYALRRSGQFQTRR
ncbi:fimbrial-like adhesin protein [Escherichia coli]|nr:fimbrial-like adhesin protein [Escherichia coli]